ncbi:MAG TPA: polymer-forming cytoskeletal protein [Candidatus Binatia bacterium]
MSWFRRAPRAKAPLFEDRPVLLPGAAVESSRAHVEASLDDQVAHFYKGSRVTGQLRLEGSARIDGSVDGEILCRGSLTVGEGAEIRANISGAAVVIRGQVEGDVTARDRVELGAPARLRGNIAAPRVVVAEGVVFDGGCAMGGGKQLEIPPPPVSNNENAFEGGSPKLVTLEK